MHNVTLCVQNERRIVKASDGERLSDVLIGNGIEKEHPCAGMGKCGKCTVTADGAEVLSCQYRVWKDITVKLKNPEDIKTNDFADETGEITEDMCLCFDIGTTTLVMALVSKSEGRIVKTVARNNPQRAFSSDVMGRIESAEKCGVKMLQNAVVREAESMKNALFEETGVGCVDTMYVAGNSVMLHLFFGEDPSGMGSAPYTPKFKTKKIIPGKAMGIEGVGEVISLELISAFVGADIAAGLNYAEKPPEGRYNILVDLGTNAEIVLFSKDIVYTTAAAAGPCFEGVNISSGMSASEGAIYSYTGRHCFTVDNKKPKGICATGLIDAIKVMLDYGIIDRNGFLEDGEFEIAENVSITQEDVRQFQVAKSAICSGVEALVKKAKIEYSDVDTVLVSGGFASKMNVGNAFRVGLLPSPVKGKTKCENNTSLLGLVKYASGERMTECFLRNAKYVDLAQDEYFKERFIENMMF